MALRCLYRVSQLTIRNSMRTFENLNIVGIINACNDFVVTLDTHRVGGMFLICLGALVVVGTVTVLAIKRSKHS